MLSAQCARASAWSVALRDSSSAASGAPVSSGPPRTTVEIKVEIRPPSGARPLASSGIEGPALGPGPASEISRTIEVPAGADAAAWGAGGAGGVGGDGAGGGGVGSGSSSTTSPQPAPGVPVIATGAVVAPASHAGSSAGSHPAAPAVHSSAGGGGSAGSVPSVGGVPSVGSVVSSGGVSDPGGGASGSSVPAAGVSAGSVSPSGVPASGVSLPPVGVSVGAVETSAGASPGASCAVAGALNAKAAASIATRVADASRVPRPRPRKIPRAPNLTRPANEPPPIGA